MSAKAKHPAMRSKRPAHPGIELDAHGDTIPIEQRLPENRAKAHRGAAKVGKKPRKKPAS